MNSLWPTRSADSMLKSLERFWISVQDVETRRGNQSTTSQALHDHKIYTIGFTHNPNHTITQDNYNKDLILRRREERSLNNNSFLGEYECSSLALDREERRDEKKRLNHLKQDQTMLVLKRFSDRKKVFRERKKTGKIRAKRFQIINEVVMDDAGKYVVHDDDHHKILLNPRQLRFLTQNALVQPPGLCYKGPLTFNDLMSTPIDFYKYVLNRLKIDNMTQDILLGHAYDLLKGTCTSSIELEYNFQECFNALTDKLDWNNPEGDRYPFDLSKPLPLQGRPGHLTVAADYFFNNDLEYLKSSNPERTYTTSVVLKHIPRFASQVDVNNDLSKPVTTHYLPKERESAVVKPHHVIASSESRNSSKNTPRFSSNDKVPSHKTTNKNKPEKQISVANKPERQIPTGHRWIPTGKIFESSTTKVDSEPLHGFYTDITNLHECIQTLDSSAGTSINVQEEQTLDLNASTPFNLKKERIKACIKENVISRRPRLYSGGGIPFQLKSNSLPHAHAQTTKTYYEHQDLRIKKAQDSKTKTSANSNIQDLPLRYQVYQGRLLASFQDDAKYEHVGKDTRSQGSKDDQD
ncbi:hypothetical protein Tco_0273296 [Tanacetum coccineum]